MELKDKDEIKDLFQKELGNYQAKVNPELWNGIQMGIGSSVAGGSAVATVGTLGKVAIGIGIVAGISIGVVLLTKGDANFEQITTKTVSIEENKSEGAELDLNNASEESKVADNTPSPQAEKINLADEVVHDEIIKEKSLVLQKKQDNITVSPTEKLDKEETDVAKHLPKVFNTEIQSLDNTEIEKPVLITESKKQVDFSKLNVRVSKQDNQYVDFVIDNVPEGAYVLWDFGDGKYDTGENPIHFYDEDGEYTATAKIMLDGESTEETILVKVNVLGKFQELPNVFTPNGDGKNDELFIKGENIEHFQLSVMDKFHNIVYTTEDLNFRWDGRDKYGNPVEDGDYLYIIFAEDKAGNKINKYQQLKIRR